MAEARGIPVPISRSAKEVGKGAAEIIEVRHPDKLYGRPEVPELKTDAWYVSAADLRDKTDAVRLAAIINHQGPQIPARVLSKSNSYRVLAGPFNDVNEARDAAKRLKIDLEIEGILVGPAGDRLVSTNHLPSMQELSRKMASKKKSFTFVHAADLHLDSPFKGLREPDPAIIDALRSATFDAYSALIDLCLEREVAFLLIAGDVYDAEDRSLRAQLRFRDGLVRLAEKEITRLCGPRES